MIKRIKTWFLELEINSTYQYLLLTIIILIATALRFYKLGQWSLWIEEHHSLRHASEVNFSLSALLAHRAPFYLLLKLVFSYLGVNEWTARLLSALIGIATIPVLYWMVKRTLGLPIALLAAVLLTIAPWHLYWSQNARFYSALLLMYTLSMFTFYWAIEKDRFRYVLASLTAVAVAGSLHFVAGLLLPVFLLYFFSLKVLPFEKPPGLRFRNLLPVIILPVIGYGFLEVRQIFFFEDIPVAYEFYLLFVNQSTASFIGYANPYVMLTAVVYYIGTPLAFLGSIGSIYLLRKKSHIGLLVTLGSIFPLLMMIALTPFASTANRYVFMTMPCWIILGAVTLRELYSWLKKRKAVLVVIVSGILIALMRDPVVEDALYYSVSKEYLGLLILTGIITCLLGLALLIPSLYGTEHKYALIGSVTVFLIILIHPLMADTMYYAYQHGHRDNWKAAAIAIQEAKASEDVFYANPPQLLGYYTGEAVENAKSIDLDEAYKGRVWFVESFGVQRASKYKLDQWIKTNCDLTDAFDQYTAGRIWKLRLYLCKSHQWKKSATSTQVKE